MEEEKPTDRQLLFAEELGLDVEEGITRQQLSEKIKIKLTEIKKEKREARKKMEKKEIENKKMSEEKNRDTYYYCPLCDEYVTHYLSARESINDKTKWLANMVHHYYYDHLSLTSRLSPNSSADLRERAKRQIWRKMRKYMLMHGTREEWITALKIIGTREETIRVYESDAWDVGITRINAEKNKKPTNRQLWFAKDLGLEVEEGITRQQLSEKIKIKLTEIRKEKREARKKMEKREIENKKMYRDDRPSFFCPICGEYYWQSAYLSGLDFDEKTKWLANMVCHYRHVHIPSYDFACKNKVYAQKIVRHNEYEYWKEMKIKTNERAKRQIWRKIGKYMLLHGTRDEWIAAVKKLKNTTKKTIEVYTTYSHG